MNILIIGGDDRTLSLYEILLNNKFNVETLFLNSKNTNPPQNINNFDTIILPIPTDRNFKLNAPLSKEEIPIDKIYKLISSFNGKIIGGFNKNNETFLKQNNLNYINILNDEKFALINAIITAEGSIEKLIHESKKSLFDSKICILGYGRIGKTLSRRLDPLSKELIIYNNPSINLIYTKIDNIKSKFIETFKDDAQDYDIIVNTIPTLIINKEIIDNLNKNVLILDLASMPGGVDFEYAKKLNIRVIHYLGVPNKVCKYSAAEAIYKFIDENII